MARTFEITLFNEKTETLQKIAVIVPTQSTNCQTVQEAKRLACHILGWKEENVSLIDTKWEKKEGEK